MKYFSLISVIFAFIFTNPAFASIPADFEQKLSELVEAGLSKEKFVGLSILVVDADGEVIKKHFGHRDIEGNLEPDNETIYELGSITKPFARLALAAQNKVELNDPISKFLPEEVRVPKPNGKDITILDLMTHTGIKFSVPCTIRLSDPQNLICYGVDLEPTLLDPYKNTTREKLYEFLTEFSYTVEEFPALFPDPGQFNSYSNVGIGLMGEFLGLTNGTSFENVLQNSVLAPLKMKNTKIDMPCELTDTCVNMAKVYSKDDTTSTWSQKSVWHLPGMSAAGGLRSSISDMELFLKANLAPATTPIKDAIELTHSPLDTVTASHNSNICEDGEAPATHNCNPAEKSYFYGWEAVSPETVFYHGGATGASQAMMMFSTDKSTGVVVLANSKVGKGEQTLYHYPNDVAVCIYQLLGKPISGVDFCKRISE